MSYRKTKPWFIIVLVLAALGGVGVQTALADGVIIANETGNQVDNSDSVCSLIEAIIAANTDSDYNGCSLASGSYGDDTIQLQAGATYTLTAIHNPTDGPNGLPGITSTITIAGQGAAIVRDNGAPDFRIFYVPGSGNLTLDNVTVANGKAGTGSEPLFESGGGLLLRDGSVTVIGSTFQSNVASNGGGGFYNERGTLVISTTTISDNRALGSSGGGIRALFGTTIVTGSTIISNTASESGGGIHGGPVTITDSAILSNTAQGKDGGGLALAETSALENVTIRGNQATAGSGGGLWSENGDIDLNRVTIDHNQSGANGGGIYHSIYGIDASNIALTNVTIYSNTAQNSGGGLCTGYQSTSSRPTAVLTHTTIAGNTATEGAGGNLYNNQSILRLTSSIVASGTAGSGNANCDGNPTANITSGGYNLETGTDCGLTGAGDQQNSDPLLGPLQDNGGDTWTKALPPDSPAIDAIPAGSCAVSEDQRGVSRPQLFGCDVGAFEFVLQGLIPIGGYTEPMRVLALLLLAAAVVAGVSVRVARKRRAA